MCFKIHFLILFSEDSDVTCNKIQSMCKPHITFWQGMHEELVT
jgi:hypothetical protein